MVVSGIKTIFSQVDDFLFGHYPTEYCIITILILSKINCKDTILKPFSIIDNIL
jgi:hypothetical protein